MRGFADGGWQGEMDVTPQDVAPIGAAMPKKPRAPALSEYAEPQERYGVPREMKDTYGPLAAVGKFLRDLWLSGPDNPRQRAQEAARRIMESPDPLKEALTNPGGAGYEMTGLPSLARGLPKAFDSDLSAGDRIKGGAEAASGVIPALMGLKKAEPLFRTPWRTYATMMAPQAVSDITDGVSAAQAQTTIADDPQPEKPTFRPDDAPKRSAQTTRQLQEELYALGRYKPPLDPKTKQPIFDGVDGSATRQAEKAAAMAKYEQELKDWRARQAEGKRIGLESEQAGATKKKAEADEKRIEEDRLARVAREAKKLADDKLKADYEENTPWYTKAAHVLMPWVGGAAGVALGARAGYKSAKELERAAVQKVADADAILKGSPSTVQAKIGKVNKFGRVGQEGGETPQPMFMRDDKASLPPFWKSNPKAPQSSELYPPQSRATEHKLNAGATLPIPLIESAISTPAYLYYRQVEQDARKEFEENPNPTTEANLRMAEHKTVAADTMMRLGLTASVTGPAMGSYMVHQRRHMTPNTPKFDEWMGDINQTLAAQRLSSKKTRAKQRVEKQKAIEGGELREAPQRKLPKPNGKTGGSGGAAPLLPLTAAPLLSGDRPWSSGSEGFEGGSSLDLPYALGGVTRRHHSHFQPRERAGRFAGGPIYPETYEAGGRNAMANGGVPDWMGGGGGGPPWISSLLDKPMGSSVQAASPGMGQPIGMPSTGFTPGSGNAASPSQPMAPPQPPPIGAPTGAPPPMASAVMPQAPQAPQPALTPPASNATAPAPTSAPMPQRSTPDPRLPAPAVMPQPPQAMNSQIGQTPLGAGFNNPGTFFADGGGVGAFAKPDLLETRREAAAPAWDETNPNWPGRFNPTSDPDTDTEQIKLNLQHRERLERALKELGRQHRAHGGAVTVGPVVGATGGRSDKLPVDVENGAYVIPADVVSALGEGNTLAGMETLKKRYGNTFKGPGAMASGGSVPIMISDGEYVVSPAEVSAEGGGDLDRGHKILDSMVRKIRAQNIKRLASLPPPAK